MARIVDRLAADIGERVEVRTGAPATTITRRASAFSVDTPTGPVHADAIVATVPTNVAARLLRTASAEAATALGHISYASLGLVTLVYPPGAAVLPTGGSGILVPSAEQVTVGWTGSSRSSHWRKTSASSVWLRRLTLSRCR
jgi:protoporphyrinogen/coproporphyrinogen III oxidase